MGLVLYDNPRSSNALKVRFMLAELGLDHERRLVPFDRPRPGWYLAVNPVGGIPALEDDGLVVSESNTILRYLAGRERRVDLYPGEPRERAPVDELLDRWSLTFRPAFFRYEVAALGFSPDKGVGAGAPDTAALPGIVAAIAPTLRLLDGLVDRSGFALGRFTIADVAAAPVLYRTLHSGLDLGPYPNVLRWRETIVALPALAAAGPVL
ncbi:Glutathione S-transferase [Gaiella occulta]|uniref:Glutathione S-transferase n=1 Tax=Gaiella occulta TaxID=1002870 RepID=A0A7M2Z0C2_9ACTN|nr:glutathione S-transferase family protein [Gaiella occulta]RDI75223.1 Glutathione S-transferase [Gaiella occulta]